MWIIKPKVNQFFFLFLFWSVLNFLFDAMLFSCRFISYRCMHESNGNISWFFFLQIKHFFESIKTHQQTRSEFKRQWSVSRTNAQRPRQRICNHFSIVLYCFTDHCLQKRCLISLQSLFNVHCVMACCYGIMSFCLSILLSYTCFQWSGAEDGRRTCRLSVARCRARIHQIGDQSHERHKGSCSFTDSI